MLKNYEKLFDLEQRFEHYLELVKLDKAAMSEAQLVETKRAFMGGFGSAMMALGNDLEGLTESSGIAAVGHVYQQVQDFWLNESLGFSESPY